jgi:hypothetical protein
MVRLSKQTRRRQVSHKRPKAPVKKTGPLKDALPAGYKPHTNAVEGELAKTVFIPKIK